MKTFNGTGTEIEWEIVAYKYKKCIDCEEFIKDNTRSMSLAKKKKFIEDFFEMDNCQNHTILYQEKKAKLWYDSNNNYCFGINIPNSWIRNV